MERNQRQIFDLILYYLISLFRLHFQRNGLFQFDLHWFRDKLFVTNLFHMSNRLTKLQELT